MTGRVWLVRHASTEWTGQRWCGRTDLPLSSLGLDEADALARQLRTVLPESAVILSSPLRRAIETAEAIDRARGDGAVDSGAQRGRMQIMPALVEVDFGAVDGQTWAEVERTSPGLAREILAGRRVDWPDGEPVTAVEKRVESIRQVIVRATSPLVLVSHAAVLGALAGTLARSPVLGRVALAPAAVLELTRRGRVWLPITGRT